MWWLEDQVIEPQSTYNLDDDGQIESPFSSEPAANSDEVEEVEDTEEEEEDDAVDEDEDDDDDGEEEEEEEEEMSGPQGVITKVDGLHVSRSGIFHHEVVEQEMESHHDEEYDDEEEEEEEFEEFNDDEYGDYDDNEDGVSYSDELGAEEYPVEVYGDDDYGEHDDDDGVDDDVDDDEYDEYAEDSEDGQFEDAETTEDEESESTSEDVVVQIESKVARMYDVFELEETLDSMRDYKDFEGLDMRTQAVIMKVIYLLVEMRSHSEEYFEIYTMRNEWAEHILESFDHVMARFADNI